VRVVVLTAAEVTALLPMPVCIDAMAEALTRLARGEAHQPLRLVFSPPDAAGLMAFMPAYQGGTQPVFGLKAIGIFPGNAARQIDTHQGAVALFDGETGELRALMNGAAITAIRTAAVSALATRLLAREDAGDLALVGSGTQARTHLEALACVRPLRRVRVASRSAERARRFAEEMSATGKILVEPMPSVEAAVRGADLVVLATDSAEPVAKREWISAGAHVNAVGASLPTCREVDSATMAAARLFVDRRESTTHEAGDYLIPLAEGVIRPDHIQGELGEVLTGARPGRKSRDEITLFKSLGLAVEDLGAAAAVCERAEASGVGTWVDF
jgi:ornithine cyclodeaminase/alanine dehydrogenase-like protein (mu-crystallin family)